jgi:apolipoprotein N-acyltransferase
MTPPAVAEAGPKASGSSPVLSSLVSAALLWSAFPPTNWGWLAWVALAPLFLLIKSRRSRAAIYAGAWVGGFAFWLLSIQWIRLTDESAWLAWVVMALALSAWWPAFLLLARLAVLRLRLPIMIAAPILWVGLEFVRAHILSGFPWYYLAHSQHNVLHLIQIADFAGALGLSFLIAMANAWWVDLLTLPLLRPTPRGPRPTRAQALRFAALAALIVATVGYGDFRLGTARFRPGPRLALMQSDLLQSRKMTADEAELLEGYRRLVAKAVRGPSLPDLIVWPETSYPYPPFVVRDSRLGAEAFAGQVEKLGSKRTGADWMSWMETISGHLHGWTDDLKVPMLVGALTYDFHPDGFAKHNAAILFEPGVTTIQSYYKIHLVPFGEYVPLVQTFPWLTALTPYHGSQVPSLAFGREPSTFRLGPYRFAAAICFEDTVPQAVRRFFQNPKDGRPPDLLINMSNDGWFHHSSELDMHLAISVFRAVENRVPLARAVNTGLSALIDGNGSILAALPKMTEGILARDVPLDDRDSLYSAWGDWLGFSCVAITLGLVVLGLAQAARPVRAI